MIADIFSGDGSREEKAKEVLLILLGIGLLCALIYSRVLFSPFLFDDRSGIIENETTRSLPLALKNISDNRYIGQLSFSINYFFSGRNVYAYHIVNLFIHAGNAILVYFLVRLIGCAPVFVLAPRSREFIAITTAFLFAVHPIQTQAVSYISQRVTALATFFYLASILFYLKARMSESGGLQRRGVRRTTFYGLSLLSALLGVKTKEITMTLPLMIATCEMYCFADGKRLLGKYIFPLLMLIAMVFVYVGWPVTVGQGQALLSNIDALSRETSSLSRTEYFLVQIRVVATYLRLFLFPMNQSLDYDYPVSIGLRGTAMIASLMLLILLLGGLVVLYRKKRQVSFGLAWFFIGLLVESSIIPIRDVIAEHRMYLPSIGLLMAGAAALDLIQKDRLRPVIVVLLVALFSLSAYSRNNAWASAENIWADVIAKAPLKARGYNNLGTVYKEKKDYQRATALFLQSIELQESLGAPYYNLGDIAYEQRDYPQAIRYLTMALNAGAKDKLITVDALNKLGRTYGAMEQYDRAIGYFQQALALYPDSLVIMNNLGVQYIKSGRPREAIALYESALQRREDAAMYINLSIAYERAGDEVGSRRAREKAVALHSRP